MEISPIPAIRTIAVAKVPSDDGQPLAVFDVDPTARTDGDREQKDGRKAAGAEENDAESLTAEAEPERSPEVFENLPAKRVDYFA
ncbi:MAG: hypothetical protein ABSF23_01980 [Terracidiphilus sp.]|jgi:hypothetical protein